MPKTFRINVSLSEAEMEKVQVVQNDLEKMFEGISVSQPDAVRHLMLRDRRHEARLHHLNIQTLSAGVAEALHRARLRRRRDREGADGARRCA